MLLGLNCVQMVESSYRTKDCFNEKQQARIKLVETVHKIDYLDNRSFGNGDCVIISIYVMPAKIFYRGEGETSKEELTMDQMPDILLSESSLDPKPVTRHIHSKYIPDITFAYAENSEHINTNDDDSINGCESYQAISDTFNTNKSDYHHNIGHIPKFEDDSGNNSMDSEVCSGQIIDKETRDVKEAKGNLENSKHLYSHPNKTSVGNKECENVDIRHSGTSSIEMVENTEYSLSEDQPVNHSSKDVFRTSQTDMVKNENYAITDDTDVGNTTFETEQNKHQWSERKGTENDSEESKASLVLSGHGGTGDAVDDHTYTFVYQHFPLEGRERSPDCKGAGQRETTS